MARCGAPKRATLRPAAATARSEAAQRQQRRPPQRTQAGRAAGWRGAPQLTTEAVDGRGAREDERGGEGEEGGLDLVGVRVKGEGQGQGWGQGQGQG